MSRVTRCAAACLIAVLCGAIQFTVGEDAAPSIEAFEQTPPANAEGDEQQARVTCGGCHAFTPPEILPRDAWRNEFVRMMFIRDGRRPPIGTEAYRTVQLPPDMERALPFFLARAPEHLAAPERWPDISESPVRFERRGMTMPEMPGTPAVSNVRLVDFDSDKRLDVLGADMRQGVIFTGHPANAGATLSIVASIPHPAHVTMTDVDRDGFQDLLVGDLGEFFPADHDKGAAIWLQGRPNG